MGSPACRARLKVVPGGCSKEVGRGWPCRGGWSLPGTEGLLHA